MAKLATMFFILIALQAVMTLYAAPSYTVDTPLWEFVTNIDNWSSLNFILGLVGIAGGVALAGIIAGTVFGFKTDFIIFAGAIGGFISIGVVFVNFANMIRDELTAFFGAVDPTCTLASCALVTWILAITIAPIAFYYVWTVVEWWRGKDY